MTTSEKVTLVAKILKERIPALTYHETIRLAFDIVTELEK